MADLGEAIVAARQTLESTPKDHSDYASRLDNLGVLLRSQYQQTGRISFLEEATSVARQALDSIPNDHPNYIIGLNNLGVILEDRYSRTGAMADLAEAIDIARKAIELTPEDHSDYASRLDNLGVLLRSQYQRTGRISFLEEATSVARQALDSIPNDHPNYIIGLNNLGVILEDRYSRTGAMADLEEAIDIARKAIELTPEDHPDLAGWLNNLGTKLQLRYIMSCRITDLEEAIQITQKAVDLTPIDHPDRTGRLNNLGNKLSIRYKYTGHMKDLEDAIRLAQQAVDLTPDDHPLQAAYLNNLGSKLERRYREMGQAKDLDRAIRLAHQAVDLTPTDHPDRTGRLNNLGNKLSIRYEQNGDVKELADAIQLAQQALDLTPDDHPIRQTYQKNLDTLLERRNRHLEEHLEETSNSFYANESVETTSIASFSSVPGLTSASTHSSRDFLEPLGARQFVQYVRSDSELDHLISSSLKSDTIRRDQFDTNLAALLKTFAIDLRREAKNREEELMSKVVRRRRKQIVLLLRIAYSQQPDSIFDEIRETSNFKDEKASYIQLYISGLPSQRPTGNPVDSKWSYHLEPDLVDKPPNNKITAESAQHSEFQVVKSQENNLLNQIGLDDSSDEDYDFDEEKSGNLNHGGPPKLPDVEDLTHFIPSSKAYSKFKISFEDFLSRKNWKDSEKFVNKIEDEVFPLMATSNVSQSHSTRSSAERLDRHFEANHLSSMGVALKIRLSNWVKILLRPHVAPGRRRLECVCPCGEVLYHDFDNSNPDAVERLVRQVQARMPTVAMANGHDQFTNTVDHSNQRSDDYSPTPAPTTISCLPSHSQAAIGNELTNQNPSIAFQGVPPETKFFLELCVNAGGYRVHLGEIDVTTIRDDGEMFSKIWVQYKAIRAHRVRRLFIKPSDVHFVRFGVLQRHDAGIFEKPLAIPPENEVQQSRYHYYECPLTPMPPMPPKWFLHYLDCARRKTGGSSNRVWINRLPKKRGQSIFSPLESRDTAGDRVMIGWGVHIVEGPDWFVLSITFLICSVISFLVAIVFAIGARSQEQGFGIASWLMTVVAAGMAALFSYWNFS